MNHFGKMFALVFALALLISPGQLSAQADDLAKQAEKIVREAERNMFSGKVAEAESMLKEASVVINKGKAEDPANKKIDQVEKKFTKLQQAVDKKLGKASPGKTETPVVASPAGAAKKAGKLPGGVSKRLKDISNHLNAAERYVARDAKQAAYKLQQAQELFAEIKKSYVGQFDPADAEFAAVQSRFNELTAKTKEQGVAEAKATEAAESGKAEKEKQSADWVAKFREYLSYPGQEGSNPAKLVFVPGTSEPEKFADAQKRFEEFRAFYEEYKKTDFPNGKTWELEDLADNQAPLRLKDFTEGFANRVDSVSGSAESNIDAAMKQLENDNGWKSDVTIKPNLIDRKWMTSIREEAKKVTDALDENDPKRMAMVAKLDKLVAKDAENRKIREERTFMTPDRFKGSDIEQLKEKAKALVSGDSKEGGEPIRCTIISENWKEETVEEWTDTSKTVWRKRITRNVTAQVAAKTAESFRLITVALSQDKQTDVGWGPLYGNLHQYSDPILEANINK